MSDFPDNTYTPYGRRSVKNLSDLLGITGEKPTVVSVINKAYDEIVFLRAQAITNGSYEADDFGPIGDTARQIASYCEGEARKNVYRAAKSALSATQPPLPEAPGDVEALQTWAPAAHMLLSRLKSRSRTSLDGRTHALEMELLRRSEEMLVEILEALSRPEAGDKEAAGED